MTICSLTSSLAATLEGIPRCFRHLQAFSGRTSLFPAAAVLACLPLIAGSLHAASADAVPPVRQSQTDARADASVFSGNPIGGDVFAEVSNYWPAYVERNHGETHQSASSLGPILSFRLHHSYDGLNEIRSGRPLLTEFWNREEDTVHAHFLYPIFNYRSVKDGYSWNIYSLIRRSVAVDGAVRKFEVWPFFWSRQTESPDTSYWGLLPVYGDLQNRFFLDRLKWVAFPFYVRAEVSEEVTVSTPWPFFQRHSGPGVTGWELWPFYGYKKRERRYDKQYALWPFYYDNWKRLDKDVPRHEFGVLPFYARQTDAGLKSETWGWPFFGYTRESDPRSDYFETRWFWPFVVTGEGEEKVENRFMPFYWNLRKGDSYEKTWFMWPMTKYTYKTDHRGLGIERLAVFYFLYWSETQRALDPDNPFKATKTHVWPFYSHWNNGQGAIQFQAFSPLEVFFPHNEIIREVYSPLFAIYRYHRPKPDYHLHNFFWDMMLVEHTPEKEALQLGPLFSSSNSQDMTATKLDILNGLFTTEHRDGKRTFRIFWTDLPFALDVPAQAKPVKPAKPRNRH